MAKKEAQRVAALAALKGVQDRQHVEAAAAAAAAQAKAEAAAQEAAQRAATAERLRQAAELEEQRRRDEEQKQRELASRYGGGGGGVGGVGGGDFPALPPAASAPALSGSYGGWARSGGGGGGGGGGRPATAAAAPASSSSSSSSSVRLDSEELFPSLGPASAPRVAPKSKRQQALEFFGADSSSSTGSRAGGRGGGGGGIVDYITHHSRRGGKSTLSSTQRKKLLKQQQAKRAAGEWTKVEKARTLCDQASGCSIRARYAEDGRWYDAELLTSVGGNQYLVSYPEYGGEQELLGLNELNVDEAWLVYEYSPSYIEPRREILEQQLEEVYSSGTDTDQPLLRDDDEGEDEDEDEGFEDVRDTTAAPVLCRCWCWRAVQLAWHGMVATARSCASPLHHPLTLASLRVCLRVTVTTVRTGLAAALRSLARPAQVQQHEMTAPAPAPAPAPASAAPSAAPAASRPKKRVRAENALSDQRLHALAS
jgi:hypothetical protein